MRTRWTSVAGLVAGLAAGPIACEGEHDEGPARSPDAGRGAPADERVFDTLLLFDDASPEEPANSAGADFCGVFTACARPVDAQLTLGAGAVCERIEQECGIPRTDPTAILEDGTACDADAEPSDFVSVGSDGSIAVIFDGDLAGCEITVVEFAGDQDDQWSAFVCDDPNLAIATCLNRDEPVADRQGGGSVTFMVPVE